MVKLNFVLKIICIIFGLILLVVTPLVIFNKAFFNSSLTINVELASKFGDFFGGFVGTLFSILSVLLLIYTISSQYIESSKNNAKNHFFKMLDYHSENVRGMKVASIEVAKHNIIEEGRRSFVVYKIQFKRLMQAIKDIDVELSLHLSPTARVDIVYMCFFYGLSDTWLDFIKGKLSSHVGGSMIAEAMLEKVKGNKELNLGRTNQTELSSYFRNMYNAIKLVDGEPYLTAQEKQDLIKIYRAQLSNPELYILFFNLLSRFGKKWKDKGYITKYGLLTNLPHDYCDGYNPIDFFDMAYEEDEIGEWKENA